MADIKTELVEKYGRRTASLVAMAILAERKRCIRLVNDYAKDAQPDSEYALACADIAEAINL